MSTRQSEANEVKGVSKKGKGSMDWMVFLVKPMCEDLSP